MSLSNYVLIANQWSGCSNKMLLTVRWTVLCVCMCFDTQNFANHFDNTSCSNMHSGPRHSLWTALVTYFIIK
jgi:hypothetical protein